MVIAVIIILGTAAGAAMLYGANKVIDKVDLIKDEVNEIHKTFDRIEGK